MEIFIILLSVAVLLASLLVGIVFILWNTLDIINYGESKNRIKYLRIGWVLFLPSVIGGCTWLCVIV